MAQASASPSTADSTVAIASSRSVLGAEGPSGGRGACAAGAVVGRLLLQPMLLPIRLDLQLAGAQLLGQPAQLLLQPVMSPLHRGELPLPLEVEERLGDLVGDVGAELRVPRGDLDPQHARPRLVADADLAAQDRGGRLDGLLLRRLALRLGRLQAEGLEQRGELGQQPAPARPESRTAVELQRPDDAGRERGRVQHVDLRAHQVAAVAGIGGGRLQVAHLRALRLDDDQGFGGVLLGHPLHDGSRSADAEREREQHDPEVPPDDGDEAPDRDGKRFKPARGIAYLGDVKRGRRFGAWCDPILHHVTRNPVPGGATRRRSAGAALAGRPENARRRCRLPPGRAGC